MEEHIPFSINAAKFSWTAPIGAIVLGVFSTLLANSVESQGKEVDPLMPLIFNGTGSLLLVAGLASGLVALRGVKQHGKAGIFLPAVIGIAINLILIASAIVVMMR